jgi:putative heme-binding domain-containing protein
MTDIQFPSRNVAEAFRSTVFTLKDGTQRSGFIVFNSADGVMLQTGPGLTERIGEENISSRELSSISLMPPALLTGLKPTELADLYAYLRTLKAN